MGAGIFPLCAAAATTLYVVAPTSSVPLGASFPVLVQIDTDQPVNAYAVMVNYDGVALHYDGANNANSLITVSQGLPTVGPGSVISWSGGSLASFAGSGGLLMTLNFTSIATGTTAITLDHPYVYLANGKGTKVVPQTKSARVTVLASAANSSLMPASAASGNADTASPTIQSISFVADPFNGSQKLLSFLVRDDVSGVQKTELRYRTGFFWSAWQPAVNPTPLRNDVWEVDFRATDNAGNIAEKTLFDWSSFWIFAAEIAIVLLAIATIVFFVVRGKKKMVQ